MTIADSVRVAVVGAGPAGLYAAEELLRSDSPRVSVDVIEALPVPFGLVRYGVAPDHPRIKAVTAVLATVLEHPRFSFYGGLRVGEDVSAAEVRARYDAVVYAVGAPGDRSLGIPGEDLSGSISAGELVAWYNGRPGSEQPAPLRGPRAIVVGAGNVALDVARILTKDVSLLRETDMPREVLNVLDASGVRDVTVLVRRGPRETRFSPKELRELGALENVAVRVVGAEVAELEPAEGTDRSTAANLKLFAAWAADSREAPRTITFRFHTRPIALHGGESVDAVAVESRTPGGVDTELLPTSLVVRSIGHRGVPFADVPRDEDQGTVRHVDGRVVRTGSECGEYVVGWCKRGPSGVLGTNKADAAETVSRVLEDLADAGASGATGIEPLLRERGLHWVDVDGWRGIDEEEIRRGGEEGRERVKIVALPDLLAAARGLVREAQ